MHILWLVRTTLPQAAAACGLAGASDVSGSWLTGQLAALRACPDLQLTVLCVGKEDADEEYPRHSQSKSLDLSLA